jgi:hypothetical protein
MTDHIGEPDGMTCPHCGLPADRKQNGIQSYRCGSSYCETFRPQWARSMTCMEIENKRLRERISVMDDESLLSSDVFETDRSIKWDLSQQIEKLKRELHAANDRIKRLEEAGDAMAQDHNPFTFIDWQRVKEVKP